MDFIALIKRFADSGPSMNSVVILRRPPLCFGSGMVIMRNYAFDKTNDISRCSPRCIGVNQRLLVIDFFAARFALYAFSSRFKSASLICRAAASAAPVVSG